MHTMFSRVERVDLVFIPNRNAVKRKNDLMILIVEIYKTIIKEEGFKKYFLQWLSITWQHRQASVISTVG